MRNAPHNTIPKINRLFLYKKKVFFNFFNNEKYIIFDLGKVSIYLTFMEGFSGISAL